MKIDKKQRKHRIINLIKISIVLLSVLCPSVYATTNAFTIFVTTNAQANIKKTTTLSQCGFFNAKQLAVLLSASNIQTIYSTSEQISQSTARSSSEKFQIPIKLYSMHSIELLVHQLKNNHKNTLLIASENAIEPIIKLLTGNTFVMPSKSGHQYIIQLNFQQGWHNITVLTLPTACKNRATRKNGN